MNKTIRLISVGSWASRRMCTAAIGEMKPHQITKSLYSRLTYLQVSGKTVEETIDEYVSEGKNISKDEMLRCVVELRKYRHFGTALQLMEWMQKTCNTFFYRDHAILLDLLSKVKGIELAEMYFDNLPPSAKREQTYGALLNCYCKQQMRDKAVTLFEKMREVNIASTSLNYNNLMALYMRVGEPEKVPTLVQEMKEKNISLDTFSYKIWMSCYSSLKDTSGVERVIKEMQTEGKCTEDWTTHSNMASGYVKAGLFEKAELALKDLERTMKASDRTAYHFLISLYSNISNLSEVYRVWHSLKSFFPVTTNASYLIMLHALAKLDDIDGLKKCFQEWESCCSSYDMRLTNVLLNAYLRRGMIKEAKLLLKDAIKRSSRPKYTTYQIIVDFFLRNRQPSMALRCLEVGLPKLSRNNWKPGQERVSAFLHLFEEEKDAAGAEKFCELLKNATEDDKSLYHSLLSNHVAVKELEMHPKMEADKMAISSEMKELVELIFSE